MKARYLFCLLIALVSGAAALTHELLWTRRLVDILGATGEATSLVLGCFFLGLSLGAAIASRRVGDLTKPWKALALIELVIALLTLPAALLPQLTEWIWPVMGPEALVAWPGRFLKLTISGAVVVPPATAMGMTLPVLVVAIQRTVASSRRAEVLIYAFNTLGGALGLLVTSVWLLQAFGVLGCMIVAMLTNVAVAGIAWAMQARSTMPLSPSAGGRRQKKKAKREAAREEVILTHRWRVIIAALSGCTVLTLEVVAIRMLSLIVPSSFQATSSVLLSVILLLGVAALLVPWFVSVVRSPQWQLLLVLSLSAIGSALSPALLFAKTDQLIDVTSLAIQAGRPLNTALDFQIDVLVVAISSIGPSILFAGLLFPLLLASIPQDAASPSGREWAVLLAANGVGGLSGAILGSYFLIPAVGIFGGMITIAAVQALAAVGVALLVADRKLLVPGVLAVAACLAFGPAAVRLPYLSPKNKLFQAEDTRFGKDGVCLVVTSDRFGRGILMNNQYLLGSTAALEEQRQQVLIPLLLHGDPDEQVDAVKQVCCLGLATGMSAGAALDFDERCHVTAVELSPMVVTAARDHFDQENRGVVTSPRATVIVEDARTYIASVRDTYDVIAGDLYRPYGAGEGRLYSLEHFRNVYRALRPGGIFCQWIPAYQVTEEHFEIMAATFQQVFPDAALLLVGSESGLQQLGLMGTKEATVSWDEVERRCRELADRGVGDESVQDIDRVRAAYVGALSDEYFSNIPINTLDNALLEISAGLHRATLDPRLSAVGRDFYLQGENWKDFCNRIGEFASP